MRKLFIAASLCMALLTGCASAANGNATSLPTKAESSVSVSDVSVSEIPEFSGEPYVVLNDNIPDFSEEDMTTTSFETYSDLDSLGRCQVAYSCVGVDIMPTEKRESISEVKPSGWKNKEYSSDLVDGRYLYNRCHLIGFQLTGENANEKNLITGTRYMNVDGMLPFENMVADYVKETENHVLYRVTPIYDGSNLVAKGVQMEAKSVEDGGDGVLFNVFCYNAQPGITIDYATGDNWLSDTAANETAAADADAEGSYLLNTNSKKFHKPDCSGAKDMNPKNRKEYTGSRKQLIDEGYTPCKTCNP